jgi:uncharacterized protein (TIGR02996 family)
MPAKPKSPFPHPAATLPGEVDILANVLADLSDHDAKLVYADWLEEHDDKRGPLLRKFVTAYRGGKKLPKVTSAPEPWRDLVGITLIEKAQEWSAPHTDTFLRLARPALRFEMIDVPDDDMPIGTGKLGGLPDMPLNVEWPVWERGTLAFLVQLNLAQLALSPVCRELPSAGTLSFFREETAVDREDVGGWRVLYFREDEQLAQRERPKSLPTWGQRSSGRILFAEVLTLPHHNYSPWGKEIGLENIDEEAYRQLSPEHLEHRLLGHEQPIQNVILNDNAERHLLTVDIGNVLYFTIMEEDLRHHRFDRTGFEFER